MIIVMQGRLCSTRLPGKGFFTFFGQTIWERMCDIALAVDGVDEVVFATGEGVENELMRPLIEAKGVRFFAGSEENVLERYVRAIEGYSGEYLVRLTCDNYLAQPVVMEKVYSAAVEDNADYAYVAPLSHYTGELIRCATLRESFAGNYSENSMEHVTWDVRENSQARKLTLSENFLGLNHLTSPALDTLDDLIQMKRLERDHLGLMDVRCMESLRRLKLDAMECRKFDE